MTTPEKIRRALILAGAAVLIYFILTTHPAPAALNSLIAPTELQR